MPATHVDNPRERAEVIGYCNGLVAAWPKVTIAR